MRGTRRGRSRRPERRPNSLAGREEGTRQVACRLPGSGQSDPPRVGTGGRPLVGSRSADRVEVAEGPWRRRDHRRHVEVAERLHQGAVARRGVGRQVRGRWGSSTARKDRGVEARQAPAPARHRSDAGRPDRDAPQRGESATDRRSPQAAGDAAAGGGPPVGAGRGRPAGNDARRGGRPANEPDAWRREVPSRRAGHRRVLPEAPSQVERLTLLPTPPSELLSRGSRPPQPCEAIEFRNPFRFSRTLGDGR